MRVSVLIPSFNRPGTLTKCLAALAAQTTPADEVIVVWQGDDTATRDAATAARAGLPQSLKILHSPVRGVVPSENAALKVSSGEIVFLIDDDAIAPFDWIEKHLKHYADPTVGAVGGPADNVNPDGSAFPIHDVEPCGRIKPNGKLLGNMYDQPPAWRNRPAIEVQHLVGYNMSLRRNAFTQFDENLRPYWQLFELDACLQVRRRGMRIIFDYGIVITHHPTNTAYVGDRAGDLSVKIYNAAYNHAFVMAHHSPWFQWPLIWLNYLLVGNVNTPGLAAAVVAVRRHGNPRREIRIFLRTLANRVSGWRYGRRLRST